MVQKIISKVKKFVRKNKKQVKIGLLVLLGLLLLLILYKSFFYSSSEKATYGVRLKDIEKHEITNKDIKAMEKKASVLDGVSNADIVIKGRLIKFFITFEEGITTDDIKAKFTSMLDYVSEDNRSYYDITFYAVQKKDKETKYPVIGYKHRTTTTITWDVF